MIPPAFIQELLARVDIVDVVGRQVKLKKSGSNWSGLCPFHAEKSPSFTVSPTKQFYHCFGCGANGDAIRFLVEHDGMAFVDQYREDRLKDPRIFDFIKRVKARVDPEIEGMGAAFRHAARVAITTRDSPCLRGNTSRSSVK